ncbi:MAG: hypothetical protein H8F28_10530 [Fibrella sp.]|nr:hypothetical protein [Armatimonadota bacterium]
MFSPAMPRPLGVRLLSRAPLPLALTLSLATLIVAQTPSRAQDPPAPTAAAANQLSRLKADLEAALRELKSAIGAATDDKERLDAIAGITLPDPADLSLALENLKKADKAHVDRWVKIPAAYQKFDAALDAFKAELGTAAAATNGTVKEAQAYRDKTDFYPTALGSDGKLSGTVPDKIGDICEKVTSHLGTLSLQSVFGPGATNPTDASLLETLSPVMEAAPGAFSKIAPFYSLVEGDGKQALRLTPADPVPTPAEGVKTALKPYTDRRDALIKKFADWFKAVQEGPIQTTSLKTVTQGNDMRRGKSGAFGQSYVVLDEADKLLKRVDTIETAWVKLRDPLRTISATEAALATSAFAKLTDARTDLVANRDLMIGLQRTGTEGEEALVTLGVNLSFFPDVARLMYLLNPSTRLVYPGEKGLSDNAAQKRRELKEKEALLLNKQGELADLKTTRARIVAQITQARAQARTATERLARAEGLKLGITDTKASLEERLALAENASDREKLQKQIVQLTERSTVADGAVTAATSDKTAAENRLTEMTKTENGLPQKEEAAFNAQKTLEVDLATLRASLPSLAESEVEAFAQARDNAPFLVATPVFDDPDTLRRVHLYADAGGKTVVLRGRREDVQNVHDVIAELDRPSPQTRLTFLSIQVNGEDKAFGLRREGKNGDTRAETAFEIIGANLDAVSAATDAVTGALRDAISDQVIAAATTRKGEGVKDERVARYGFYADAVRDALGDNGGDDVGKLTRYTLPDPIRITTLGEMIFVLSLGSSDSRRKVAESFQGKLEKIRDQFTQLSETGEVAPPDDQKETPVPKPEPKKEDYSAQANKLIKNLLSTALQSIGTEFGQVAEKNDYVRRYLPKFGSQVAPLMQSLREMLGLPSTRENGLVAQEITPAQREILDALQTKARTDVAGTVYNLLRQLDTMPEEIRYNSAAANDLREQYLPLVGWLSGNGKGENKSLWKQAGINSLIAGGEKNAPSELPADVSSLQEWDRTAFEIARMQYVANPLFKATGRIEAADSMIRAMIDHYDGDLNRLLRRPAMNNIRYQISTNLKGVSLGAVEETSFLATNRRVTRVEPVGTGSLTASETVDYSEAASTLATLYTKQKEREGTQNSFMNGLLSAGVASAVGAPPETQVIAGAASLISGLLAPNSQNPENDLAAAGEVYSISSGNVYKVTPIFGPSGQSMRFQFDFAGTTRVREPGGTLNPTLPRIERHTVNTEVALTNLEMKQIASFDSNYQIGLPKRQSGGLPLVNQLPLLKELPLVGYFTKREGEPSLRQRSVILAQSVMYPTIGDIIGLMLDGATLPVTFSAEAPASTLRESERNPVRLVSITPDRPAALREVVQLKIQLRRPVTRETTISLRLNPGGDFVMWDGKSDTESRTPLEVKLNRGQDFALFDLKFRPKGINEADKANITMEDLRTYKMSSAEQFYGQEQRKAIGSGTEADTGRKNLMKYLALTQTSGVLKIEKQSGNEYSLPILVTNDNTSAKVLDGEANIEIVVPEQTSAVAGVSKKQGAVFDLFTGGTTDLDVLEEGTSLDLSALWSSSGSFATTKDTKAIVAVVGQYLSANIITDLAFGTSRDMKINVKVPGTMGVGITDYVTPKANGYVKVGTDLNNKVFRFTYAVKRKPATETRKTDEKVTNVVAFAEGELKAELHRGIEPVNPPEIVTEGEPLGIYVESLAGLIEGQKIEVGAVELRLISAPDRSAPRRIRLSKGTLTEGPLVIGKTGDTKKRYYAIVIPSMKDMGFSKDQKIKANIVFRVTAQDAKGVPVKERIVEMPLTIEREKEKKK